MRIAIVHDYIKEYGGAERVLEELLRTWPQADIYTSVFLPEYLGPHKERFTNYRIHTSWLQYLPFKAKLISPFRLISPLIFKGFDLSSYDVIITSQTGAYFPTLVRKGNSTLFCYTHTPPRYLYGYKTAREWKNNMMLRVLGEIANHFLRIVDYYASGNVDYYITNSEEVKRRIQKFYRREALVINPPVSISNRKAQIANLQLKTQSVERNSLKSKKLQPTTYYLTGGRLARAKGIDVVIDAFIKLKKPLKVFGRGFAGYEQELVAKAELYSSSERSESRSSRQARTKNNVEFLGEVNDEEKFELMKDAKAFIFASFDEDFGITPVEAMSVGTPVIAYRSGGVVETVVEGKTGIFYDSNTPEDLAEAVKQFEKARFKQEDCVVQAEKFSDTKFRKKIKEYIEGKLKRN